MRIVSLPVQHRDVRLARSLILTFGVRTAAQPKQCRWHSAAIGRNRCKAVFMKCCATVCSGRRPVHRPPYRATTQIRNLLPNRRAGKCLFRVEVV